MSTNKTTNYKLHSWVTGDKFLREEMNENFTKLDAAAYVAAGRYSGDGGDCRTILLGFTPRAVLVISHRGEVLDNGGNSYGGLAVTGGPGSAVSVCSGGFQVRESGNLHCNFASGGTVREYYYIAVR